MNEPLLEVRGLKKYFPIYKGLLRHQVGEIKAVDGIDVSIGRGQVVGLVGESGSGKSSAGRAMIRLIEPTEGSLLFENIDLMQLDRKAFKKLRRKIQIIFQNPFASLNPRKTIFESLGEGVVYHQQATSADEETELVIEALRQVGLSPDLMDRYPHQFSGGQQQRICIARAIALKPSLIICDEVVSALDVSVQAQIINLLQELRDRLGLSYLFISHDLGVVRYLCDEVLVMYRGQIIERGKVEELFCQPHHSYTKQLLAAIPIHSPHERSYLRPK